MNTKNTMKAALILLTLGMFQAHALGVGHGGGGDSYLAVDCKSSDGKVALVGDVGISCAHEMKISGDISATMTQTCTSDAVKFIYTEASRTAGKIIISGSGQEGEFHLVSQGPIKFKTDGRDINEEYFDFTAEFTFSTWVDGSRVATVKSMTCSGESFSQP